MIKEPLLDQDFLKKLYNQKNREVYARLIALDFDENPLEEISGKEIKKLIVVPNRLINIIL